MSTEPEKPNWRFGQRLALSQVAHAKCTEHGMPLDAFGVVSALYMLGVLSAPPEWLPEPFTGESLKSLPEWNLRCSRCKSINLGVIHDLIPVMECKDCGYQGFETQNPK